MKAMTRTHDVGPGEDGKMKMDYDCYSKVKKQDEERRI